MRSNLFKWLLRTSPILVCSKSGFNKIFVKLYLCLSKSFSSILMLTDKVRILTFSLFKYRFWLQLTIFAFGKKIQEREGTIEDFHLYLKNLIQSASYWRTALNDLFEQIRPPHHFLTSSSKIWFRYKKSTIFNWWAARGRFKQFGRVCYTQFSRKILSCCNQTLHD